MTNITALKARNALRWHDMHAGEPESIVQGHG